MVSTEQVKSLRDATGISIMQCKKALEESGGDVDKALEELRKSGLAISKRKQDRTLGAGTIGSYVHTTGDLGAMVELLCETDFVGKNSEFQNLAKNIAMHLTAIDAETKEALLSAPYIKNPEVAVSDLIKEAIQKFGENIDIGNFTRFSILGR